MTFINWLTEITNNRIRGRRRRSLARRSRRNHSQVAALAASPAEVLEDRQLLTAVTAELVDGTVVIQGTDDNDQVYVKSENSGSKIVVRKGGSNGTKVNQFGSEWVDDIVFYGEAGNDYFQNKTDVQSTAWGGDGKDTLKGGDGVDYLFGEAGNDTLKGGKSDDVLNGGDGNDYFGGGDGDDVMVDSDSNVNSSGNNDTFDGDDGDNLRYFAEFPEISVNGNTLVITGNSGHDHVSIETNSDGNYEIILGDEFTFAEFSTSEVSAVEFDGGDGDDTFVNSTWLPASVDGGNGDDYLVGGYADDVISGGAGNDHLRGRGNNDTLNGGSGSDDLYGDHLTNESTLTAGDLLIDSDSNTFVYGGGGGNDLFIGHSSADQVDIDYYAPAEPTIELQDGVLVIEGSENADDIRLDVNGDDIDIKLGGGFVYESVAANDVSSVEMYGLGDDDYLLTISRPSLLDGGNGNDTLWGAWSPDTLLGGSGNDSLAGRWGDDWLDGGDDADTISEKSGNDVAFDLDSSADTIDLGGDAGDHLLTVGLPSVELVDGVVEITGDAGGNDVSVDVVDGLFQVLVGDSEYLHATFDPAHIHGVEFVGSDEADSFENSTNLPSTITGGDGNDTLIGGSNADRISGGDGADWIKAKAGHDTVVGGDGVDTVFGNGGNDLLIDSNEEDVVNGGSGDNYELLSDVPDITLADGTLTLDGHEFDDVLHFRQEGAELELRIGGADGFIYETFDVNDVDRVFFNGYEGDDLFVNNTSLPSRQVGGDGDDRLYGNINSDTLIGGGGDDELKSYKGADVLDGGEGSDTVNAGGDTDVIVDMDSNADTINAGSGRDLLLDSDDELVAQIRHSDSRYVDIIGTNLDPMSFYSPGGWTMTGDGTVKTTSLVGNASLEALAEIDADSVAYLVTDWGNIPIAPELSLSHHEVSDNLFSGLQTNVTFDLSRFDVASTVLDALDDWGIGITTPFASLGLASGSKIKSDDIGGAVVDDAPLLAGNPYFYVVAGGEAGVSVGNFEAGVGNSMLIVADPTDPMVLFGTGDFALGFSAHKQLQFDPYQTPDNLTEDVHGDLYLRMNGIPVGPVSVDGSAVIDSDVVDDVMTPWSSFTDFSVSNLVDDLSTVSQLGVNGSVSIGYDLPGNLPEVSVGVGEGSAVLDFDTGSLYVRAETSNPLEGTVLEPLLAAKTYFTADLSIIDVWSTSPELDLYLSGENKYGQATLEIEDGVASITADYERFASSFEVTGSIDFTTGEFDFTGTSVVGGSTSWKGITVGLETTNSITIAGNIGDIQLFVQASTTLEVNAISKIKVFGKTIGKIGLSGSVTGTFTFQLDGDETELSASVSADIDIYYGSTSPASLSTSSISVTISSNGIEFDLPKIGSINIG